MKTKRDIVGLLNRCNVESLERSITRVKPSGQCGTRVRQASSLPMRRLAGADFSFDYTDFGATSRAAGRLEACPTL
jgi:hypothetical protein